MAKQVGFRIVFNRFPEAQRNAPEKAKAAVKKATYELEARAKGKAPVDTGALRNSIASTFENDGFTGIIGPSVHYAIYQELGTYKMPPHPYLGPAAEEVAPIFTQMMQKLVEG